MEVARALFDEIDIEHLRRSYPPGMSWELVKKEMEDKYRKASRAKGIACLCCNSPVEMVLNEDRACFFRHSDKLSCPGSENYTRYTTTRTTENQKQHHTGKVLLKELLEGQLKIHGAEIQYGYLYKEILRIIPDLLIYFPNGDIWAVDYITGSRSDDGYHTAIQKRLETYNKAGFKPFFLLDSAWYSQHADKPQISLYKAERVMMRTTAFDEKWQEIVSQLIRDMGENAIVQLPINHSIHPLSVCSLVYIDMNTFEGHLVRFIPIQSQRAATAHAWGYTLHKALSIPIDQLLSLDTSKTEFKWYGTDETALQEFYIQDTIQKYFELEEQVQIEKEKMMTKEVNANAKLIQQLHDRVSLFKMKTVVPLAPTIVKADKIIIPNPVSRIDNYRLLIERFQKSGRLDVNSGFNSHIEKCEEVIRLFDETGEDRLFSIYAMMENMKHALLGE